MRLTNYSNSNSNSNSIMVLVLLGLLTMMSFIFTTVTATDTVTTTLTGANIFSSNDLPATTSNSNTTSTSTSGDTSATVSCPAVGAGPQEITLTASNGISPLMSLASTVCDLVHLKPKDPSSTISSTSDSSDYLLTPVSRSYDGKPWERVAGPFQSSLDLDIVCPNGTIGQCDHTFTSLTGSPYDPVTAGTGSGSFYLMTFENPKNFDEELVRLFSQSTYGATRTLLAEWKVNYEASNKGIALWIKDQMELPVTSLRETYRKGADFSIRGNSIGNAKVVPRNPCEEHSRWRDYIFTADDYGRGFEIEPYLDGLLLVVFDGMPRGLISSFRSKDGRSTGLTFDGAGSYTFGYRCGGEVGADIIASKRGAGQWRMVDGGNPEVHLNLDIIAQDPEITSINLPSRAEFEEIRGVYGPGVQTTPVGGSFRLTRDISCDAVPDRAMYNKVVGKVAGEETYWWYDAYAVLDNNTPDAPVPDGGMSKTALGLRYCSNAPKHFFNIETCHLSEEAACAGGPQHTRADRQPNLPNTVICGSPNEVANIPDPSSSQNNVFQFNGVSNQMFYASMNHQDPATSFITKLTAEDQLRHRVAWAFAELLVVTLNQIDNGELWSEMFLNYKDIFVRNAFGNYRDILREVSYSPMMAEMLSFLNSASSMYVLTIEGRVSRPDENYAREIMQLFSIGLYELNMDGTYKLDTDGEPLQTYDNTDIQTFARAWTGFQRQAQRSNSEGYWHGQNKIDPMWLNGDKRDPFPKMDLNEGFVGDGYPLCADIPSGSFLRKGAKYHLVGNWNKPELSPETSWWRTHGSTTRMVLDASSPLYQTLCNSDGTKCSYQTVVELTEDLTCYGDECAVDTLGLIKIQNDPPLYYEFMPFPCVELAFSTQAKKVVDTHKRAMCADPHVKDVVFDSCCPVGDLGTSWQTKASSYCKYSGEKMSFDGSKDRCELKGGIMCDFKELHPYHFSQSCGLGIQRWSNSFRWTSASCSTQVKVESSGLVSIVHNPNLDINSVLSAEGKTLQQVHQPVSPWNKNFFKVKWDADDFPSVEDGCGTCTTLADGCLCDVSVANQVHFEVFPTVDQVISELKVGSIPLEWMPEYSMVQDTGGVQMFNKSGSTNYAVDTIFGVTHGGETRYFMNSKSIVTVDDGAQTYSFRNPPSLMSIIEQKTSDAYYETEALLDMYINHDNTPPFIASRMIKRFVTSNPSPGYIERVATAFKTGTYQKDTVDFGDSTHGSLEATFAAILLDDEARTVVLDADPTFGSLKEPILKLFAFMRAMEFTMNVRMPTLRMVGMITTIGQEPFRTPNVFSSFMPEYANPGAIQDASLTSPEAQIFSSPTIVGLLNGLMSMIDVGLNACYGGFGMRTVWNCGAFRTSLSNEIHSNGALGFSPTDDSSASAVVDELALLLTGGRLSENSRAAIETEYNTAKASGGANKALRMAQKLIVTSPEFHATSVFKPLSEARPEPPLPPEPANPYKAVVYVNLDGGLDSFNALVPHSKCGSKDMYNEYRSVRGDIALVKSTLKTISTTDQVCGTFGVHPDLSFVHQLYNDGDLAFLANLGVLQQPVSPSEKRNYRKLNKKTALFSHNTQQEEVNSVDIYDDMPGQGILGRMADMLGLNGYTPSTLAVNGGGPALVSSNHPLIKVNPSGYVKFNPIPWEPVDLNVVKEINKATEVGSNVLSEVWAEKMFQALNENSLLYEELSGTSLNNEFPTETLGKQMKTIAQLIKTRGIRNVDRDLFYARLSGFDTHGAQEGALSNRLRTVNGALSAFVREMKSQQVWDSVTVVFVSEFGRTLRANTGNGSDHAWGGNYFMASGDLKGGKVLGEYPDDLTSSGDQIVGNVGIVIPSTPWEALWNGVAEWLGLYNDNDLATILPNRAPFEGMLWKGVDLFYSVLGTTSPSVSSAPSVSSVPSLSPSIYLSTMPSPVDGISPAPSRQIDSLMTNFLVGEFWTAPESGIMFDISVTEDVTITRLDIDLFYVNYDGIMFPTEIEIYTKAGSYVGYQSDPSMWTKHMDTTTVLPPDVDDISTFGLTPLGPDILPPIIIPGGTSVSIFITNIDVDNFIEMAYNETAVDYVSLDNVVTVETGIFQRYADFNGDDIGSWWGPVAFSGIIYYDNTANDPSNPPSLFASASPSTSALPSLQPSTSPSAEPSVSMVPSTSPSSRPSLTPSTYPSITPSAEPSVSVMPSLMPSSHPSEEPSISVMPSLEPSSHPSEEPSISVMPSLHPSSWPSSKPSPKPSSRPSRQPSSPPTLAHSEIPTGEPSPSPTRRPTRTPTKEPTSDTPKPTTSTKPSYHPTKSPTTNPTTTVAPSAGPVITSSPSEPLFQTIVTTCSCTSPFRGISPSDLANRFAAIVSLLQAVMQKLLGPNRANWGTRVVRVGGIVARRLSIFEVAEIIAAADQDDVVEVEYEFTNTRECYSDDGCNADEQAIAVQEGFEVLATVETVVTTGQLQQTIIDDSDSAGLSEELSSVEVGEVTVSTPEIEVVDATAYPSIYKTPAPVVPTSSPTYDCEDSPLRFKVMKDGKLISRYCSWVRVKRNSRCKLPGIREQCPQSCWRCRNCADSTLRFKILNKGIEQMRSCEWVGRRDTVARCTMIEGVSLTCPLTCGTCTRKTASPSINGSGSPSSAPSTPPTPVVSVVPTSLTPAPAPTPACYDSPLRFRVKKDETFMNRYCSWVATIPKRCINDGVPSICPQSCGACDTCADSSLAFKLSEDDNDFVSCDWVGEDTANRCSIEGVDRTCRATCGIGSSCCSDSTEQFQFTYNGKVINRFCEWAARKDTKNRCAIAEVSTNCPETCGSCDA